jgi:PAS domain S-box-containing protein
MGRNKHLNFINELSFQLNQEIDLMKCCKIIIANISKIFDFDGFFMELYDEKRDTFSNVMATDIIDGKTVHYVGLQNSEVKGLMKEIIQTHKPILLLREHENDKLHGLSTYGNGTRRSLSLMYAPLLNEGKVIGVMNFNSYKKNAFSQKDFDLFIWITSHLSVVMRNSILYRKLSNSENQYKTLFHHSPEAIFSFDPNGILLAVNPEALKLFLVNDENDMIGKNIDDFISKEAKEFFYKQNLTGFHSYRNKQIFVFMGKDDRSFELTIMPVVEDTQEINSIVAIIRDITSDKEVERINEIIQQQKLESKKHDFIVNIIKNILHVFNNMFVNVLSRSSFAKTLVDKKEPIYLHLEKIALSAERINELMKQLSLFATGGYYSDVKSLNLNKTIKFFYLSKQPQISKEIDFQLELIEPAPFVISNNDQIIVMLEKLLDNSIEAIVKNTKKRIIIKTSITTVNESKMIRLHKIEKGNYGLIIFSDNGCGINDEVMSKLYEPFNTTKEYYRGLSLASIYGMLMSMDGLIDITTKVGEGTKIRVWLPLAKE